MVYNQHNFMNSKDVGLREKANDGSLPERTRESRDPKEWPKESGPAWPNC